MTVCSKKKSPAYERDERILLHRTFREMNEAGYEITCFSVPSLKNVHSTQAQHALGMSSMC